MRFCVLVVLVCVISAGGAHAGARHFTYIYEATPTAPGGVEFENWVTWKNVDGATALDFRHELEFGLTNHLQASVYLADWNFHEGNGERARGFSYDASAIELIYNLSNPVSDPLGLSLYQEYRVGDRSFEWESKVIAQKNFGRVIPAYNATLEAKWEGDGLAERAGEFQHGIGVSYEFSPRLSVGAEALHEVVFPDWRGKREMNFFVGPNVSVRSGSWFATATALAGASIEEGEPDVQVRTIVGYSY